MPSTNSEEINQAWTAIRDFYAGYGYQPASRKLLKKYVMGKGNMTGQSAGKYLTQFTKNGIFRELADEENLIINRWILDQISKNRDMPYHVACSIGSAKTAKKL